MKYILNLQHSQTVSQTVAISLWPDYCVSAKSYIYIFQESFPNGQIQFDLTFTFFIKKIIFPWVLASKWSNSSRNAKKFFSPWWPPSPPGLAKTSFFFQIFKKCSKYFQLFKGKKITFFPRVPNWHNIIWRPRVCLGPGPELPLLVSGPRPRQILTCGPRPRASIVGIWA